MSNAHRHRSLQEMVEDQVHRWTKEPGGATWPVRRPVLAVSRQEGTHGEAAARAVALDLGMDYYDREIVHLMADKAHIRERVLRSLDERGRSFLDDMFTHLIDRYGITSDEYFDLLRSTIGAIDWHGNAVIVGRGAAQMIRRPENLTVRFVAPLPDRIAILSEEEDLTPARARERIREADREREAFLHRYFRTTPDTEQYDLVIDNRHVGLEASIEILEATIRTKIAAHEERTAPAAS